MLLGLGQYIFHSFILHFYVLVDIDENQLKLEYLKSHPFSIYANGVGYGRLPAYY
jgi:hypothetical protein